MNKEEYMQFYALLAKLKYELEIAKTSGVTNECLEELKKQIEAIDEVMRIFFVECD